MDYKDIGCEFLGLSDDELNESVREDECLFDGLIPENEQLDEKAWYVKTSDDGSYYITGKSGKGGGFVKGSKKKDADTFKSEKDANDFIKSIVKSNKDAGQDTTEKNFVVESTDQLDEGLRSVKVTFDNGYELSTSMASGLTDDEIKDYYKVGKQFNVGHIKDKMAKVKKIKILKWYLTFLYL